MQKTTEVAKIVSENLENAVPWTTILELVMTLLSQFCFKQNALKSYASEFKDNANSEAGIVKKIIALVLIKRELNVRRREAIRVRDELFNTMEAMTPEELDQVQKEVNESLLPETFVI